MIWKYAQETSKNNMNTDYMQLIKQITSQKSSVSLTEFPLTSKSSFYRPIYLPAGKE